MRGTLSVFTRSAAAGPRAAAVLATLRGVADEIVVAIDSRADPAAHVDVAAVADRILVYPYADPVERATPWLFAQCRCDWALAIDDDEVPSLELLEALPELLADRSVAHCSFPIRWLFPDTATYLDEWPWRPHYAARLLRTDERLIRFSDEMHRSILTTGPGRFLPHPLVYVQVFPAAVFSYREPGRVKEPGLVFLDHPDGALFPELAVALDQLPGGE